jgi:hypothetical protein
MGTSSISTGLTTHPRTMGGAVVLVHGDAVVDFQDGILTLLAHIKPNGDDGHVLVDME